ncbi:MAG: multidrug effflux MFS transporter [Desulfovibrio sp.]
MTIKSTSFAYTTILAGISALPPLSIDMNLPAIPEIEASFQMPQGQGSLTLSLFLLGFAVAPLFGGPLADRYGRRITLLFALATNTLAAFACGLSPSFHILLFSRLVQGIACGVCILVPLAILRDMFSGVDSRKKLSTIMFVSGVAPLVAPIVGGWILFFGKWQAIYFAQGGIGLALFFLVALEIAESLPMEKRIATDVKAIVGGYGKIFTDFQFISLALSQAFYFGCMFSYVSGSPGFMLGQLHLSEQGYSLVFACTTLGVMAGAMTSGILGRWEVHPNRIIMIALSLMAVASTGILYLTYSGNTSLFLLVPLLFVVMGCFGIAQPNVMSEAVTPWGNMAGTVSGALNTLQMLGGVCSSTTILLLTRYFHPGRAMGIAMVCAACLAVACYGLLGRFARQAQS